MDSKTLNEIRQIELLKYRYVRALDTQDWALLEELLTDDINVWFDGGAFSRSGLETVMEFNRSILVPSFVSSHLVSHPEIELTSPSTATGIWRLEETVYYREDHPVLQQKSGDRVAGAAYYYDQYRKESGSWKISDTGYVAIYKEVARFDEGTQVRSFDPARGNYPVHPHDAESQ